MIPLCRYWRLRFTANNGGDNLGVAAMNFHNRVDGPGLIDVSTGEAIASHGDASGAFNGGDPWYVEFVAGQTWIGWRFEHIVTPARVSILSGGPDAPLTAVVEASGDGEIWYPIDGEITFDFSEVT